MQTTGSETMRGAVAWITGSSRGIGRAIAERLAAEGAAVVVHGSTMESPAAFAEGTNMESLAAQIATTYQVQTSFEIGDLTDPETVRAMVASITSRHGGIDVLVNCAGGDIGAAGTGAPNAGKPQHNDPVHVGDQDLQTVMRRNVDTVINACRAVAPQMMERRSGSIVTIGSIAALEGLAQSSIYSTAKAAVHQYSRCLAQYLRPYNVRVNVVAPGNTATERFKHSRETDPEQLKTSGTLLRYGTPEEVAAAVAMLAGGALSYVSGQVMRVDGGQQTWSA